MMEMGRKEGGRKGTLESCVRKAKSVGSGGTRILALEGKKDKGGRSH